VSWNRGAGVEYMTPCERLPVTEIYNTVINIGLGKEQIGTKQHLEYIIVFPIGIHRRAN